MDIISKVFQANLKRTMDIFGRRMLKLGEEFGEACQAYLSISSENNSKNKSWEDVREELTDCIIVAIDLYCHQMPDEADMDQDKKIASLHEMLDKKLKKWHKKQKKKEDVSE